MSRNWACLYFRLKYLKNQDDRIIFQFHYNNGTTNTCRFIKRHSKWNREQSSATAIALVSNFDNLRAWLKLCGNQQVFCSIPVWQKWLQNNHLLDTNASITPVTSIPLTNALTLRMFSYQSRGCYLRYLLWTWWQLPTTENFISITQIHVLISMIFMLVAQAYNVI